LAVALIAYAFLVIFIVTKLSPAAFWLDVNSTDATGRPFNIDFAFNKIFTQGQRIIFGSLVAFLVSQLLDAFVFHKLRSITGNKKIWLRATGSTLVSQLVDSFVVLFIAFAGTWPLAQVISVGLINYAYKFAVAILLTPVLYLAHALIDNYLRDEVVQGISKNSTSDSLL
jgi:queuosine precursor transporter